MYLLFPEASMMEIQQQVTRLQDTINEADKLLKQGQYKEAADELQSCPTLWP
jgi:hypothetical protein